MKNNKLSEEEIQDEVSTLIMAVGSCFYTFVRFLSKIYCIQGNASTAISMSSVLLMLAIHQEVQEKVFKEIMSVLDDNVDEIDQFKINKLEYLDLVIKETMRLFPVAPIIARSLNSDLVLNGN